MTKVKVICGWCRKEFEINPQSGAYGYGQLRCPHCVRFVRSSKKLAIEGATTGRQHVHSDLKSGDVV